MADAGEQSIIIKRGKKCPHASHGGAWKIAFADLMTATMAFFLMLWVLGGTNDEERKEIAAFFRDPSVIESSPEVLVPAKDRAGQTTNSLIDMGGMMDAPMSVEGQTPEEKEKEQQKLEELKEQLEKKIDSNEELSKFKEQLQIDITPSGLRIQVLDDRKRPMFDSGVDVPKDYAAIILKEMGGVLKSSDSKISIAGHTDSLKYKGGGGDDYTNWELSADRSNAARRELINGGVKASKVAQVVGLADTVPYDRENPYNPRNRRISIIVLTKEAERNLQSLSDSKVTSSANDLKTK